MWLADGTFKCNPPLFDQLFVIHGLRGNATFPLVYCLTPNRTAATYVRVLNALKSARPNLYPKTIISDFEQDLINAFNDVFPEVEQQGCFFHYRQSNLRQLQKLPDLYNLYCNDPDASLMIHHLFGLAFLPPEDVVSTYELLLKEDYFVEKKKC